MDVYKSLSMFDKKQESFCLECIRLSVYNMSTETNRSVGDSATATDIACGGRRLVLPERRTADAVGRPTSVRLTWDTETRYINQHTSPGHGHNAHVLICRQLELCCISFQCEYKYINCKTHSVL